MGEDASSGEASAGGAGFVVCEESVVPERVAPGEDSTGFENSAVGEGEAGVEDSAGSEDSADVEDSADREDSEDGAGPGGGEGRSKVTAVSEMGGPPEVASGLAFADDEGGLGSCMPIS